VTAVVAKEAVSLDGGLAFLTSSLILYLVRTSAMPQAENYPASSAANYPRI